LVRADQRAVSGDVSWRVEDGKMHFDYKHEPVGFLDMRGIPKEEDESQATKKT
jgi:hypothetical protein